MVLSIISFALEIIFMIVVETLSTAGTLTQGFSIFTIIMFVMCTIVSLCTLIFNAKHMKDYGSRAPRIVGLIFSIIGLAIGLIFCITFFATLASIK